MNSFLFLQKNHLQDAQKLRKWKKQIYVSLMPSYFMDIQNLNKSILRISFVTKSCKDICDRPVLAELFWYQFLFTKSLIFFPGGPRLKLHLLTCLIFLFIWMTVFHDRGLNLLLTGWTIKIGTHSFDLSCSHDRNPPNFNTKFLFYYTELSF